MGGRGTESATAKKLGRVFTEHAPWESSEDVASELGISVKDAMGMVKAIKQFTSDSDLIRENQQEFGTDYYGDQLERFIELAPKWAGGQTRRGIRVYDPDKFRDLTTVGAIIDANGNATASWSTSNFWSGAFAGNDPGVSIVFVNQNPQRRGTSIKNLSSINHEDEVLVSKNATYKVVGVWRGVDRDYRTYVNVEEI